ncbi:hypothetical protein [Vibrio sp. H11]|uniref:hypothetical protein n=1 Tax=Vibrio sp. H11 TaxID=2565928 RepID=UPI001455ED7B|nr:hypothetical protein [Vibrio sp. H11]
MPNWLNTLGVVIQFGLLRWVKLKAKQKRQQREERVNAIKADPDAANAERFGPSSGRVSIHPEDDHQ